VPKASAQREQDGPLAAAPLQPLMAVAHTLNPQAMPRPKQRQSRPELVRPRLIRTPASTAKRVIREIKTRTRRTRANDLRTPTCARFV